MAREVGEARGILWSSPGPGTFHHARLAPSPALAGIVQHFWIVRWDLRGHEPHRPETLPHPNVHLVVESDRTQIQGVHTGRFTRVLDGEGCVFGVKFRPGGFRPFFGRSVSLLRNRSAPICDVFGAEAASLEREILSHREDAEMVAAAERFFSARLPLPDADVERVSEIVDSIAADRSITAVEQVMERWCLGKRMLQRWFNEYVGVGPKWVINRYRLHEAIERLAGDLPVDWTQLALELGYFDQAHFIRDFKALVGVPPAAYVRQQKR
jgi:AraC-like DNA-binding protein